MKYDMSWIAEGLKKPGKTKKGLAAALGRAPSMATSLMRGNRELLAREVEIIARYLEVVPPSNADPGGDLQLIAPQATVPIIGTVEAGSFREFTDLNQDDPEFIPAEADPRWPDARRVAMRVAGDSMNALTPIPIFEGAIIICVDYEDIAAVRPLRNNMVVVIQRTTKSGHMREWSVKQIEVQDDRYVFHPRSTNSKHKPIIVPLDLQADDGTEVIVLAEVRRIDNPIPD